MSMQERNAQIVSLHNSDISHADIGRQFGVSRERVRQIVAKSGVPQRREMITSEWDEIVSDYQESGLGLSQFCAFFGICYQTLWFHVHKRGVPVVRHRIIDAPEFDAMVEKVRQGASYYRAAGCDRVIQDALMRRCSEIGVKSRHESRNPNYRVAREERAVSNNASAHKRNAAARQRGNPVVKQAAKAGYGKRSASEIAKELGVSRNSVIGHWFRLRQKGELA